MVVKELVALVGIKTDKKTFDKADKKLGGLVNVAKKAAIAIGGIFAAAKIARGIASSIQLASSVNETLNVLGASFEDNSEDVMRWADQFGAAAGRSVYDMRDMAAQLGAVLNPMMDRNSEAAATMSMRLAELTVDLASFFNAMEPDVLIALRSGISGEAEPLKKFGIVMNEAALASFASANGINKSVKAMSNAEKTTLRYNFILEQTATAHGDAIKTALGFANASKALRAKIKDLSIRFGLHLIPPLEEGLALLNAGTPALNMFADTAGRAVGAVIAFATRITKWASSLTPLQKGILGVSVAIGILGVAIEAGPIGQILLLITLMGFLIEDFVVWQEGGRSAIGAIMKKFGDFLGMDLTYDQWISDMKLFAKGAGSIFDGLMGGMFETFASVIEFFIGAWDNPLEAWKEFNKRQLAISQEYLAKIQKGFDLLGIDFDVTLQGMKNAAREIWAAIVEFWRVEVIGAIKSDFVDAINWMKNALPDWFGQRGAKTGAKLKGAGVLIGGGGAGGIAGPGAAAATSSTSLMSWSPQTSVDVSIQAGPGMSEAKLGGEVAKQVEKVIEKQNRAAMRALTPEPAGGP